MISALQVTTTRHGPCVVKPVSMRRLHGSTGRYAMGDEQHKTRPDNKPPSPPKGAPLSRMPGPRGLPLLGTLHHYFKKDGIKFNKLFEVQCQRAAEYGDIYVENLAGLHMVMVSCPYEYRKVIHAEAKRPKKFMLDPLTHYKNLKGIKHGIVTSEGDDWYKQRSLISKKMLVISEVLKHADKMGEVADDFVNHVESIRNVHGEVRNLQTELLPWALESLGIFLFNERLGCLADSRPPAAVLIRDHLQDMVTALQQLMYGLPLYKTFKTIKYREFERHADVVFEVATALVEKKLNCRQKNDNSQSDFLMFLMESEKLTREEIVSVVVDILLGGIETTRTTVIWNLYALAKNPQVQEEMCKRLHEARKEKGGQLNAHGIASVPYVRAVVKETFRAFPTICATSRFLPEDLELAGYDVPAGTHVQANLYGMYRDARFFDKPDRFLPERWVTSHHQVRDPVIKSLPLLTWGHGPRICVGRRIAELEMYLVLSKIVERFKLSHSYKDVGQTLTLVLSPDRPVAIGFTPRT